MYCIVLYNVYYKISAHIYTVIVEKTRISLFFGGFTLYCCVVDQVSV